MKALALFGGGGVVTAAVTGGSVAIVIGNLAILSATAALFLCTLNLTKAS